MKQTVRRGNYIPVKLSAQEIKHLNLSNADLEYGIHRMSEIMKYAKNAEYEKMLTKRNRIHAKFQSRLENQDKYPDVKIIPECTRFPDGQLIPQYWVHFRLSPNDRIDYLKDLYKRFR